MKKASIIRLSVGVNQDEVVLEETVDLDEMSTEMKEIYLSLSRVVSIRICHRKARFESEHVGELKVGEGDDH